MSKYTIEIFGLLLKAMTAAPRATKINLYFTCEFRHTLKSFSMFLFTPWQTRTHCCGHIVADTNLSPFARARNSCCEHKFCVRDSKMFLILFRSILCPQQMFPSFRSPRNIMGNNVSSFTVQTIWKLIIEHRVNPDTIGCVWTGAFVFQLNMLGDRGGFE